MKNFVITSAAVVLGCAGLAAGAFGQSAIPQTPANQGESIIILQQPRPYFQQQNPYFRADSEMGNLRLMAPAPMQDDSVYVDGSYVGVAGNINEMRIAPGAHNLLICAPNGTPVYRHNVTVAADQTTEVQPFEQLPPVAAANTVIVPNSPSAVYVAPPAPAYVPQPQPAEAGNLRLNTPYSLRDDAVFIDGSYVGQAKKLGDLELTTGTHEVALCAPDGMTDFVDTVGISQNHTTHLRPSLERPSLNG